MKYPTSALLLLLFIITSACSVEEPTRNPDLVSKWELMEVLQNDAGNPVYKPTDREETVEFLLDSKVRRSVSWCQESKVNVATYSPEEQHILAGCGENKLSLQYQIKGDLLFIYPNCEEACTLKYRRIDNLVGFIR